MPYRYNVKIDFWGNWINRLKRELQELGYDVKENGFNVAVAYFNLKKRLIEPKKRKVLFSQEFQCPENLKSGLNLLIKKIENGEDIRTYLSKYILSLDYNDGLLNDWGIYHLHLGIEVDKKSKFINRTCFLLFARFDEDYAYFINTYKHGAWTKQEMISIIHNNWPKTIEEFRVNRIKSISPKLTDEEYNKLRKRHLVTVSEVGDNIKYFPIGCGCVASGKSIEVMEICDYYFYILKKYENYIKYNIIKIVSMMKEAGSEVGNKLHFYLWLEGNTVYAYELFSRTKIELGYL